MTPIPESSPMVENKTGDAVSAMCQELSAGLSLLSNFTDPFSTSPENSSPTQNSYTTTVATSYTNVASTEITSQPIMPPISQGMNLVLVSIEVIIFTFHRLQSLQLAANFPYVIFE